jgi:rhodanese-related sulfurtransferase
LFGAQPELPKIGEKWYAFHSLLWWTGAHRYSGRETIVPQIADTPPTRLATIFCKGDLMAHQHPPRFLKIVADAKTRIRETNVPEVKKRMDRGDKVLILDVREESEYAKDHLPGAVHMGKGVIERDIEMRVPDLNTEMILYCGGGFRSALAADNLQKMGYTNVISMDGGIRDWREKGYPLVND